MRIGILALQGDFQEHATCFTKLDVSVTEIRSAADLEIIDGLVIPGGESTTIAKLLNESGLNDSIVKKSDLGMPIWGTCAGLILISKELSESDPPTMGLIDIKTSRNYYGRQIDSFVENIYFASETVPFEAIFIRAPGIIETRGNVVTLAKSRNKIPIAVREDNILGTSFHPELTDDLRIHEYFLTMAEDSHKKLENLKEN